MEASVAAASFNYLKFTCQEQTVCDVKQAIEVQLGADWSESEAVSHFV